MLQLRPMVPTIHTIGIASLAAVRPPDRLRTVLGSCVGVALFCRSAQLAGLAHVILPSAAEGSGAPEKFADSAVDLLVERMVENGAARTGLVAKIAGGASMFGSAARTGLGERNIAAVRERLRKHAIPVVAEDCGGNKGRRICVDPGAGTLEVQIIAETPRLI